MQKAKAELSRRRRTNPITVTTGALFLVCLLMTPARVPADGGRSMETGRGYFLAYCASCHGSDARGDGPVSPAMKEKPSDLTQIASRREGRFPTEELAAFISGKKAPAAHGSREMPVWGTNLIEEVGEGDQARLIPHGPLRGVLDYLESIQK